MMTAMDAAGQGGKRPILMLSPVMPDETGPGIAQRAGVQLRALAGLGPVHLLVIPVLDTPAEPSALATRHAARIGRLNLRGRNDSHAALIERLLDPAARAAAWLEYPRPYLTRCCTSPNVAAVDEWCGGAGYAALHVQRLYLVPFLDTVRRRLPSIPAVLDLDDDEVLTRQRIAALHRADGAVRAAALEEAEARKYAALADRLLPRFSRVLVCACTDAARLAVSHPQARFGVLPNAAPVLAGTIRHLPRAGAALRLLMVGTMGYLPNADAARHLCRDILPALRALTSCPVTVEIVGPGGPERLADLAVDGDVRIRGWLPDLGAAYASADIAVVPLRAGGGTRIKILEAFAHRVPVVATSLGAEGLDIADGTHLLLADTAAAFASACLDIAQAPGLAARLTDRAADLVRARYDAEKVAEGLRTVYANLGVPACETGGPLSTEGTHDAD